MPLWNGYASKIFTALLVALLIGRTRSFPALELPASSILPAETETQEETSSETATSSTNSTDDSAVSKASGEQQTRISSVEDPSPQPLKLDYYDYLQLPNDPDDEIPALPDHAVNVNEDYAGIYDYRGSQDGRFRRKRTLTTNVEQLLTRSSRIRSKRSVTENAFDDSAAVSPAEQAENLVTLLSVMQDSDPEFDATEFLKVLDAPSVSEQDLEYLLFLSNLASQKDSAVRKEFRAPPVGHRRQPDGRARIHLQKIINQPFYLSPDVVLPDDNVKDVTLTDDVEQEKPSQKTDFASGITSLLSARGPSAGIAM